MNVAMAYNYGNKGADGKRPTQWVDGAMFGDGGERCRATRAYEWLLKGKQIVAYLDGVHVETYEGQKGFGAKLTGRIYDYELVSEGTAQPQAPAATQPRQAPQQRPQAARPAPASRQAPAPAGSGFDDLDDDIPF